MSSRTEVRAFMRSACTARFEFQTEVAYGARFGEWTYRVWEVTPSQDSTYTWRLDSYLVNSNEEGEYKGMEAMDPQRVFSSLERTFEAVYHEADTYND